MHKLGHRPHAGEVLGHKAGFDLTGYRAVPFAGKRYRIVYRLDRRSRQVTVIAIAKQAWFEAYRLAAWRAADDDA